MSDTSDVHAAKKITRDAKQADCKARHNRQRYRLHERQDWNAILFSVRFSESWILSSSPKVLFKLLQTTLDACRSTIQSQKYASRVNVFSTISIVGYSSTANIYYKSSQVDCWLVKKCHVGLMTNQIWCGAPASNLELGEIDERGGSCSEAELIIWRGADVIYHRERFSRY